jgi:hypothetical protein
LMNIYEFLDFSSGFLGGSWFCEENL